MTAGLKNLSRAVVGDMKTRSEIHTKIAYELMAKRVVPLWATAFVGLEPGVGKSIQKVYPRLMYPWR
jgi:hypothetical protein